MKRKGWLGRFLERLANVITPIDLLQAEGDCQTTNALTFQKVISKSQNATKALVKQSGLLVLINERR
jgi:hypothetical protein